MTVTTAKKRPSVRQTWVEVQREHLERSSERTPGRLVPEDGVGAAIGGTAGLLAGLLIALAVIFAASPMEPGVAPWLSLGAGLLGVAIGAATGAVLLGRRAHQARAEFQALRDAASDEAPVQLAEPSPVAAGPSVFGRRERAERTRARRR